jgi:hypothetical protein
VAGAVVLGLGWGKAARGLWGKVEDLEYAGVFFTLLLLCQAAICWTDGWHLLLLLAVMEILMCRFSIPAKSLHAVVYQVVRFENGCCMFVAGLWQL